ncbi:glycerophosphodiester phosphodiesterase [Ornithinibacillus caprae]|uniref:glycerophosphodiester phosphodiesterase n=1 Tax=Ornithinibacillus caprae TaxID=2678566 RepID=UPI001FE38220|nr:glycerophosphodiester phosphodiesterase [Ornithinibacillus caprae]
MNGNVELKTTANKTKKKSLLKIIGIILGGLVLLWGILYFFPVPKISEHPYFENDRPLVIAHQGGEHLAPSSTLEAFRNAADLGVDVIEFDVHITKDGHLVAIHDPTVDRTTNGEGIVNDMTLAEVQSLDAATYFTDINGENRYHDQDVYIPTVEEIFDEIPNMRWNIEIKDSNYPELYLPIAEKLWSLIQQYDLEEHVLIASFDQEIMDMVKEISNEEALVSGGRKEVTKFVAFHKFLLNGLYWPTVEAVQIPTQEGSFDLMDPKLIKGAERIGLDVHYWTINEQNLMTDLIELGADGIITDRPDLLIDLLEK